MKEAVQIIVTPLGERLAVLPEEDYLMLLAASEDEDGDVKSEFLKELRQRRQKIAEGEPVIAMDALRRAPQKQRVQVALYSTPILLSRSTILTKPSCGSSKASPLTPTSWSKASPRGLGDRVAQGLDFRLDPGP